MKKLKVYLDTSIINFLEANDAPEYKKATENFFENIVVPEKVEVYISTVVIDEINGTVDGKIKNRLHEHISWNFKHLANINKEQKILGLNRLLGTSKN